MVPADISLSFIYEVYEQSRLPGVYGGEYGDFHDLVQSVVRAWIQVGFKLYFVFDGTCLGLILRCRQTVRVRSISTTKACPWRRACHKEHHPSLSTVLSHVRIVQATLR